MHTVMKFITYCPILKHTSLTSHLACVFPLSTHSSFNILPYLLTQVSMQWFHWALLRPCSHPGLSASASSQGKHPLAARGRVAAPSSISLGLSPRDGKQCLSPTPNKRSQQQPPPQPTSLTSSMNRFTIFSLRGTFSIRRARNFIKTQRWLNSSSLWQFSPGRTGRIDSRLLFPLDNAMVLPIHTAELYGCFKLALPFPLEQDVGFNVC